MSLYVRGVSGHLGLIIAFICQPRYEKLQTIYIDLKGGGMDLLNVVLNGAVEATYETLVESHDCGFFDGGCYTLAYAVNAVFPTTSKVMHISRTERNRDHAIVYFPVRDEYFDADGFQTKEQLFQKMRELEATPVEVLLPFDDIDTKTIFPDINEKLQQAIKAGFGDGN